MLDAEFELSYIYIYIYIMFICKAIAQREHFLSFNTNYSCAVKRILYKDL